ncbi:MAG: Smr/MutS family protein [Clostridiales bacterium]|jgi:DNA-nicking Smr family endonuclease|nr:Smr/MutS family protein [Clostridiales bacterium]
MPLNYDFGVAELDVHGMNKTQAKTAIDARLRKADRSIYRIRVIHGYHGGTAIRELVRKSYKNHPKVLRIEFGLNQGSTDLVLREL